MRLNIQVAEHCSSVPSLHVQFVFVKSVVDKNQVAVCTTLNDARASRLPAAGEAQHPMLSANRRSISANGQFQTCASKRKADLGLKAEEMCVCI